MPPHPLEKMGYCTQGIQLLGLAGVGAARMRARQTMMRCVRGEASGSASQGVAFADLAFPASLVIETVRVCAPMLFVQFIGSRTSF